MIFTLLVVAALLWANNAFAGPFRSPSLAGSSTTTISYQGRLLDAAGNPINANVGITFRLYATDAVGTPLWEEHHPGIPVQDGLFHVLLGSTNPIPASLLAANNALWLGVQVGGDSEMTPREQIASVPYAMIASTVADGAITTAKIADGAVTTAKIASDISEPSRIQSWVDDSDYSFEAYGAGSTNMIDPGVAITVPAGKAYFYVVSYSGRFSYDMSERANSSSGFFGHWTATLLANDAPVTNSSTIVYTGYRQDWSAIGGGWYWTTPYNLTWAIRLEAGTYDLKIQVAGYSDNTMNKAHVSAQRAQVMRVP